jgi:hypothetical protein
MSQAQIVTDFASHIARARRSPVDAAMPLLLLGPSVRLGQAPDEMLVLTPSNRVTRPDDPFHRIVTPALIDPRDGFAVSDDLHRLAEAEQDGRDAAHVLADLEPEIAALASDLFHAAAAPAPLRLIDPLDDGAATRRHVPEGTLSRLRDAVAAARRPSSRAAPLLLGPEMRVPSAAVDESEIRRLVLDVVRRELAGELGARIAREVGDRLREGR